MYCNEILSIDLRLQNRSHLHALVITKFDIRSYKMRLNLSNIGIAAHYLNLADYLKGKIQSYLIIRLPDFARITLINVW